MVSRTARLNLRITEDLLEILEEIRERRGAETISDLVREALDSFVYQEADGWNSDVINVKLPRSTLDDTETLVMAGDATDISQAVNFALNDWIKDRKQHHLEGRDALRRSIEEHLEERAIRERLKSTARKMSER